MPAVYPEQTAAVVERFDFVLGVDLNLVPFIIFHNAGVSRFADNLSLPRIAQRTRPVVP